MWSLRLGPGITDAGLEHLRDLTALESLWLAECKITDAMAPLSSQFTKLTCLHLSGTKMKGKGKREVKKALRGCTVF